MARPDYKRPVEVPTRVCRFILRVGKSWRKNQTTLRSTRARAVRETHERNSRLREGDQRNPGGSRVAPEAIRSTPAACGLNAAECAISPLRHHSPKSHLRNRRQLRGFPRSQAASHFDQVSDPILMQNAGGDRRAVAARAMDRDAAVAGISSMRSCKWFNGILTLRPCAWPPTRGISDIHHQRRIRSRQLLGYHGALMRSVGHTRSGRPASASMPPRRYPLT
jgi:hypothetical protein